MNEPHTFAIVDPRTMAGNAYEVGGRAIRQIGALLGLAETLRKSTELMARNAHMERGLDIDGNPDAIGWETSPHKRMLDAIYADIEANRKKLETLAKAIEFDPKL